MKHLRSYRKFESVYYSNLIKESALTSDIIIKHIEPYIHSPDYWIDQVANYFGDMAEGGSGVFKSSDSKQSAYPGWTNQDFQNVFDIMNIMICSGYIHFDNETVKKYVKELFDNREKLREKLEGKIGEDLTKMISGSMKLTNAEIYRDIVDELAPNVW